MCDSVGEREHGCVSRKVGCDCVREHGCISGKVVCCGVSEREHGCVSGKVV